MQGPIGRRQTEVIGLKQGAGGDGTLAEDALTRLDRRLLAIAGAIERAGEFDVAVVATSAVRDAPNRRRVEELVHARLGAELVVLTGTGEAELAYRGARLATVDDATVAVIDIGGASTEIAVGSTATPRSISLDLGVVRTTTGARAADRPDPEAIKVLRRDARAAFEAALAGFPPHDVAIGVAGTFTSLAAVDIGKYDSELVHGHVLSATRVEELIAGLAALPLAERRRVPGLHPDRAAVIVTGGALALGAMEALASSTLTVSERDLLDGVALAAMDGDLRAARTIS
ncbi:MAG: hypothetical protein OEM67_12205 [Thermoleophilia bacterium]|nr:hypothetical protein [Thermoleophilia bacterium]